MATIQIVKYKIRRGTDAQRRVVVLDQGELGYTIDTKRLFLGTGTLSGGEVVGSKIHRPLTNTYSLTTVNAEIGDMVMAKNVFYQLTANDYTSINSWKNVGPSLDGDYLSYDASNKITINDDSITASKLDSSTITDGLQINSGELKVDINTNSLEISTNQISIKEEGIGSRELATAAFASGLEGGGGSPVSINYDTDFFYIKTGNLLSLSALPSNSFTFSTIDSDWIGDGLIYDGVNEKVKAVVKGAVSPLTQNISGAISMESIFPSANNEWSKVQSDEYGRIVSNRSSIYDTVSCLSATNGGSLSSLFNGTPNQTLSGSLPNVELTTFTVLSSNSTGTTSLILSSAGFLIFEGNSSARQDGKYVGRFAIPIFSY